MTTYSDPKPAGTPTWIDLMTPDIDAARKFYREVFGWEYDIGNPEFGGYTTARLGQRMNAGLMGSIDDSPFGRIAALADPFGANFKVVQLPAG